MKTVKAKKYSNIMDVAKEYLSINGVMDKWNFTKNAEKKLSPAKFKIFYKWTSDVEKFESNVKSKQTKDWYISLLEKRNKTK